MGKFVLLIILHMLLLFITYCLCVRPGENNSTWCIEEERQALLTFKHSFGGPYIQRLWSWQGHDCCAWDGVSCDKSTRRVFMLDLRAPRMYESIYESYYYNGWESLVAKEVNPSLMKLKYLKYLDLSCNDFNRSSIPQFLGQMKRLTYLNLSSANFGGRVPHHLGNLSSLEFLDLNGNHTRRLYVDDLSWAFGLSSLQYLDMGSVYLFDVAPKLVLQVFTQLPSLSHLSLSYCDLSNTHLFSQPFTNFTLLPSSLRYLDLSGNSFHGPIPDSLQNFTSLDVLDFSSNLLNSSIPLWLGNLKNLEFLHLANNELNSPENEMRLILGNLSNLRSLDLSSNQFSGTIPLSLWRLSSSLKYLDLSYNKLNGIIPSSVWRLSSSLKYLDLSYNKLNGIIPSSLERLSNLMLLDLSNNNLYGMIPKSIGQLVNLRWLALNSNALEGVISLEYHLANLSSLNYLNMGSNYLIKLQTQPNWMPHFQLEYIGLRSCTFESRRFPAWLQTQNNVKELDLSNTSISDTFPLWLLENKSFLNTLDLSYNHIKGPLPPHLVNGTEFFSEVIMRDNMLNGSIPSWFCNMPLFGVLDLSKNKFSGGIRNCLMNHEYLEVIDLSSNNISGIIPSSFQNKSSIKWLLLSNNSLTGPIPLSLSKAKLVALDLGENRLSGKIPTWIGESTHSLQILNLRNNTFNGIIPPQLCLLVFLQIMDLADNDLEGSIPICLGNLKTMIVLGDSIFSNSPQILSQASEEEWNKSNIRQVLKDRYLEYTSVLKYVVNIDLAGNRLVGSIPEALTQLQKLVGLNLARNQLSGSIPKNIGNMWALQSLDLSQNQLSGEIPDTLSALIFLSYLNLSNNNLEGTIPQVSQLQIFNDLSIYEGNPHLCGPPLPQTCNGYDGDGRAEDKDGNLEKMWFYIVVMAGYATGFWTVVGALLVKKRWRLAYFTFVDVIKEMTHVSVAVKMGALKKMMRKLKASQPQ